MKRAIVNLATRGNDQRGQRRLAASIAKFAPEVDTFMFTNEKQVGAPSHKDAPYAFKTFAIDYVRKKGYNQILWLDASIWAVADIEPIWKYVEERGILFQESGHMVGNWTNDRCLEAFGVSRDKAVDIRMIWAGFTGLDFTKPETKIFFDIYHKHGKEEVLFRGAWNNDMGTESADPRCYAHRHDQSVASLIVDKMKIKISDQQFTVYVGGPYGHKEGGIICMWAQGHI